MCGTKSTNPRRGRQPARRHERNNLGGDPMNTLVKKLKLGCSVVALTAAALTPVAAFAQAAPADDTSLEEVVVTGTSIRGVAPVGSNLISVGTDDLRATGAAIVTQALATVPALSNFGATVQGGTGAHYQPSIHSLGASASNSTLVLIDGHRGPTGGTNHTFLDPNIIPFSMVERVEVLAEGASATYGSDAVAGVINFITRKRFDGVQVTAQTMLMDGAKPGYNVGVVAGTNWDTGSVVFGASASVQSALKNSARDWTYPDLRERGGTNFLSFNCSPATLSPGGQALIFRDANATTGVVNAAANATCTNWDLTDRVGEEERQNLMLKVTQELTENLTIGVDMVYGRRRNESRGGQPSVQATVFGTGPQANPFFRQPVGYTGTNTTQTVRWDPTELFGPQLNLTGSDSQYASFTANYRFNDNWSFDFLGAAGRDVSDNYSENQINGSVANLALNGTTNGGGSLTAISIPGTNVVVTNLPLTAASALDVWNPAATNRTSQAVRDRLLDNDNILENTSGFQQVRGIVNGTLFELPAGPVKVAVGGELLRTQLDQFVARANNSGPASAGSQQLNFNFDRKVYSGFVEANVPIVGPEMNVPLMRRFDVNLSYRYDHYDDFGETTNPRIAFNWDVIEGLRFRGNYSTSFVAPPLTVLGDEFGAFATAGYNAVTNNVPVSPTAYPLLTQFNIPGCTTASATCNISSLQGIQVTSGDTQTGAQEGKGWSLGFDWNPTWLPGLRTQATYWTTEFRGGVTGPNIGNVVNTASANFLLTFYPQCATAAQLDQFARGIPQRTTAPACTQYIFRSLNSNWLNLNVEGIDYSVQYTHTTDAMGDFRVGVTGTQFTKYTQSFGSGSTYDILDTTGNNGQFPSVGTTWRGNLGWTMGAISADLFANYTGKYKNWSGSSVTPITRDAIGNPSGGGDKVKSSMLFDANLSYEMGLGLAEPVEFSLSVRNIFDKKPPFYNGGNGGYDQFMANPFGRRVTVGVTAKFF
jgi:iron complex outermembrane receptor protein